MTEHSSTTTEADRGDDCPLPLAHDRFDEAHWFLHQMLDAYHHPATFRFSTNAFLNALKSVLTMLRLDLERLGHNEWRREHFAVIETDELFRAFARGRDVVVHRGSLVRDSQVEMGLFKFYKVKIAIQRNLKTDEPSHSLLRRLQAINAEREFFVPKEHPFVGEQLGVRRLYYVPQLSANDDVVTASHKALLRVALLLREAHELLGRRFDGPVDDARDTHDVSRVAVYLETDMDPDLVEVWGW